MIVDVLMPKMGESITEGTIVSEETITFLVAMDVFLIKSLTL